MTVNTNFCGRTRREFLWETGAGFTGLALSGMLAQDGFLANLSGVGRPVSEPSLL